MIELSHEMDPALLLEYLLEENVTDKKPTTCILEVPGEGNMNVVLRMNLDHESLIIKQSKPYVNKYPQIPAPENRVLTEAAFYQYIQANETLRRMSPRLLHFDGKNHLLVLEDLGESSDLTLVYRADTHFENVTLEKLIQYLSVLHDLVWSEDKVKEFPRNIELRRLNHQHIFVLPFDQDNGFDLDMVQPGLSEVAERYLKDQRLADMAMELGEIYLGAGKTLLHGDYYPGSWLQTEEGVKVIDPEFSFMGPREFDLAVFLAHGMMARMPQKDLITRFEQLYKGYDQLDMELLLKLAGVEIFRRLIGLAQLPLDLSVLEKKGLLNQAYKMLRI
ncbi:MAG: phosphotransferase [Saprospiraceae bacterium]|nr:phosphotransferase [Saprospiraceae bacterium]